MIPDRKQQLFQITCLQEARRMAKAGQKFSPIKLRSLKDARFQLKSSRPESANRLNESVSKFDLLNEELRRRSVISLSPTASSEQLELSPRVFTDKEIFLSESKEGSPAPFFNDIIKPDLPEINEILPNEEVLEDEKSEEKGRKSEEKGRKSEEKGRKSEEKGRKSEEKEEKTWKNQEKMSNNQEKDLEIVDFSLNSGEPSKTNTGESNKIAKKTLIKKIPTGKGIIQRNKQDVLEFMEERKMKKKLTKSQERGLLDRLQGFSTKFLANNK